MQHVACISSSNKYIVLLFKLLCVIAHFCEIHLQELGITHHSEANRRQFNYLVAHKSQETLSSSTMKHNGLCNGVILALQMQYMSDHL